MLRRVIGLVLLAAACCGALRAAPPRPVKLSLEPVPQAAPAGSALRVRAVVRVEPGWHVNSDRPIQDFLVPTRLHLDAPPGWQVLHIRYPPALVRRFRFAGDALLSVWEHEAVIDARLEPHGGPREVEIRATLRYQACNDQVCLPPATVRAEPLHLSRP